MRLRKILTLSGVAALALGGCDDAAAPDCEGISNTTQMVRGDTVFTSTGLRYIDLEVGAGAMVSSCNLVTTQYVGSLADGTVFEQSTTNIVPGLGVRTEGFEQGVIGMRAGGTRRLIVPPSLGYGGEERRNAAGEVVVPANSTLLFELFVVEVEQTR